MATTKKAVLNLHKHFLIPKPGWPGTIFVSRPRSEIIFGLFVAICSLLVPIFASCVLYVGLILNRRKMAANMVTVLKPEADKDGRESLGQEGLEGEFESAKLD